MDGATLVSVVLEGLVVDAGLVLALVSLEPPFETVAFEALVKVPDESVGSTSAEFAGGSLLHAASCSAVEQSATFSRVVSHAR